MDKKKLFFFWRHSSGTHSKTSSGLEKRLGYTFKNAGLKTQALTHKSYANEKGHENHNERLEFLGDSVFDLCVSDLLMQEYPFASEGDLSKMRAALVNTIDLSKLALQFRLDREIKLGLSEKRDSGQLKPRLLACMIEAVVGAVYLDGGYKKALEIVKKMMGQKIKEGPVNRDYKSILQEFAQKKFQQIPSYHIVQISGRQHEQVFSSEARLKNKALGEGKGRSKKEATQAAALAALKELGVPPFSSMDKIC